MADNKDKQEGEEKILSEPISFILSDESINKSGYRIITGGIRLEEFKANPIMFYNHLRRGNWDNNPLPIGKWENVRVKGKQILADARFHLQDEFAKSVYLKVKAGILNAASVGIGVIKTSSDAKDLEKGQTRSSIVDSLLMECSVVDIPRNGGAMRVNNSIEGTATFAANTMLDVHLYTTDSSAPSGYVELNLNENPQAIEEILPLINNESDMSKDNSQIIELLGLEQGATPLAIVTEITKLQKERDEYKQKLEEKELQMKEEKCQALVDQAVKDRKITEGQKSIWLNMAKGSYEDTKTALETMSSAVKLSQEVNGGGAGGGRKPTSQNLSDAAIYEAKWAAGELTQWQASNPEEYERCRAAYEDEY